MTRLACGIESWQNHQYTVAPQHAPLSRPAAAALPDFDGVRRTNTGHFFCEGAVQLYLGGQSWRHLTLARAGILPFFWLVRGHAAMSHNSYFMGQAGR